MQDDETDADLTVVKFEEDGSTYELVLPHASRDHIQRSLLQTKRPYELLMLQDMARKLAAGDVVLDIGANVGNHTIYLAAVAGARVHAFEPNAELCAALQESVQRNGLQDLVNIYSIGISDRTTNACFAESLPNNLGAQSLKLGEGEISVAPIDSFSFEAPIRMFKIDVEGMEAQVLDGAAATIARDRPTLYVECRDESEFRQIADWAEATGYTYWQTFNATPTHLFVPTESLSIDQRLDHLNAVTVIRDYRLHMKLQEKHQALAQARAKISELQSALNAQTEELAETIGNRDTTLRILEEELAETIGNRDTTLRILELEKNQLAVHYQRALKATENRLARAQAELGELHKYAQYVESKYRQVLESETWRAMEPVRWALRTLKGKPTPRPFESPLSPVVKNFTGSDQRISSRLILGVDEKDPRAERVVVFLATYPARRNNLPLVVAALLPQCDVLQVYLNEYEEIPACLNDDRITAVLGKDAAGDLKDNGKFFGTRQYPDSYHIFVDDDILYPPDYVENIVDGIKNFGYRAIVGYHGTIYNSPVESYLRDRSVIPFYSGSRSTIVDQLGTGTAGYHTSTCLMELSDFESQGVADLWFAKRAAECGIPLVVLPRADDSLLPMPENGETIFRQAQRDDSTESALLQDKLAPALRTGPRRDMARLLGSLYAPAHFKRHKFNLDKALSGAFGASLHDKSEVHFAVIVVGWNSGDYLPRCLASIERQMVGNYTLDIYAYDDCSNDTTRERLVQESRRLKIKHFRGESNMGPAFARDFLLRKIEDPQTICVLLDMDDELLPHALAALEQTYRSNPDCWMTYGNWVNQHGKVNDEGFYSAEEIDSRRYRDNDIFKFTHLRSFRRFLCDKVEAVHLTDENGDWLRYCSDVGLLLPLADQCASKNIVAFERPMYLYNQYRPTGTQKRFREKKKEMFLYLRDKVTPVAPRQQDV